MVTTTYLELEDQATGANNNTWGDVTDANLGLIEQAIARIGVISAAPGGSQTLSGTMNRNPIIRVTGILTSNAILTVRTVEKNWIFINNTTGGFTVTVKTAAGTGKTIPRGLAIQLYCDGTNVEYARAPVFPSAVAGGSVNALTASFNPPITSADLQVGLTLFVNNSGGANTGAVTLNVDGMGALALTKFGGVALVAGDIHASTHRMLICYNTSSGGWELLNPAISPRVGVLASSNTWTGQQIFSGGLLCGYPFGYRTGAGTGAAVTQGAGSGKSTAVNLDSPTGQITMNAAALASGTIVTFIFTSTTIAATDVIDITPNFNPAVYQAWCYSVGAGTCSIAVRQDSGASRSDAVVLNYAVIKGSNN